MRTSIVTIIFVGILTTQASAQLNAVDACSSLAEKALRDYSYKASESAFLASAHLDHCEASQSFSSISQSKQTSFSGVFKQINRFNAGSSGSNASISETYDAFCKHSASEFSASQSELESLNTIRDRGLEVIEMCLASAAREVVVNVDFPAHPEDSLAVSFGGGTGNPTLNGVDARNAVCSVNGERLSSRIANPLTIGSARFTVTCRRQGTSITLWGLEGMRYPRGQVTFLTNFSDRPLNLTFEEAVVGPLQDRLEVIEDGLVRRGTVAAMDRPSCPGGWSPFGKADGRAIIGASTQYAWDSRGGNYTHTLSLEQMPSHNHGGSVTGGGNSWVNFPPATGAPGKWADGGRAFGGGVPGIPAQGGSQPFSLMQPYIALTYCVKN